MGSCPRGARSFSAAARPAGARSTPSGTLRVSDFHEEATPSQVRDDALEPRSFERPLRHTSIRTLDGLALEPGALWGPNRLSAAIYAASSRLQSVTAVTRTGRFVALELLSAA